jgi:hypothetical protein
VALRSLETTPSLAPPRDRTGIRRVVGPRRPISTHCRSARWLSHNSPMASPEPFCGYGRKSRDSSVKCGSPACAGVDAIEGRLRRLQLRSLGPSRRLGSRPRHRGEQREPVAEQHRRSLSLRRLIRSSIRARERRYRVWRVELGFCGCSLMMTVAIVGGISAWYFDCQSGVRPGVRCVGVPWKVSDESHRVVRKLRENHDSSGLAWDGRG